MYHIAAHRTAYFRRKRFNFRFQFGKRYCRSLLSFCDNEGRQSYSYTNTQYTNYGVQKYNEGKTSITPEITEGSFSFPRGNASGNDVPNPKHYYTTDWYLGYLEGTEYGSWDFHYAKASNNSVTIKAGIGSNDKTMKWYKGPFSGNGIAYTGSSAYSYSLHYVMRLPG